MSKTLTISTLILALALPSLALQSQPNDNDGFDRQEQMTERMQKNLGLTADQTAKIKAIREKYVAQNKDIQGKIQAQKKVVMETLMADNPNRAQVEAELRKMADLRVQAQLIHFDQRQETSSVLTAEQRAKMKTQMKDHHEKMKKDKKDWKNRKEKSPRK
ncbi:MAG: periplasmic heavy metal sensor [Leptonema sp. (in: Bacteria)]|nr:periplasmic heavy metal sensor [Leptonema sp. (in: bacteria)]